MYDCAIAILGKIMEKTTNADVLLSSRNALLAIHIIDFVLRGAIRRDVGEHMFLADAEKIACGSPDHIRSDRKCTPKSDSVKTNIGNLVGDN